MAGLSPALKSLQEGQLAGRPPGPWVSHVRVHMGTLGIVTMRGLIQEGGLGAWAPASLMLPSEARASRRRLQMAFLRPERWAGVCCGLQPDPSGGQTLDRLQVRARVFSPTGIPLHPMLFLRMAIVSHSFSVNSQLSPNGNNLSPKFGIK